MSQGQKISSPQWPSVSLMVVFSGLVGCAMLAASHSGQNALSSEPKSYPRIDVSCMGETLDQNSASISSYEDTPIRIQMAWQVDSISRHYLSKELPAGSLTLQQAEMLVYGHCADDAVGRSFSYSDDINEALKVAQQVDLTPPKPAQKTSPSVSLGPTATP